ncbi:hypothetical protein WA588_000777, partial [Blastocystis sp. NMH]
MGQVHTVTKDEVIQRMMENMGIKDVDSKVSEKDIESANTVSDMNLFVRENSERDHWEDGTSLYLYQNCQMADDVPRDEVEPFDESRFDVTLVTTGSMVRSIVMPIVASRWNGPIVFVMYLKEEELDGFNSFLQQKNSSILCHDRIRIYSYVVSEGTFFYKNFPINILRNIGIHHVRTSHFLMLDIDMWMSENSYERILALPPEIKNDPKTAVVVPAFFHTGWSIFNGTFQEQLQSVLHRIPFSMQDLIQCNNKRKCSNVKKHLFTHYYTPDSWLHDKRKGIYTPYYNITCWKNPYQEPYLIVHRDDNMTRFHEGFINYGYNKISYVETLRLGGYRFVLGGDFYAFDLPHLPSRFQKQHVSSKLSKSYMTNYYYMQKVRKRFHGTVVTTPLCKKK